VTATDGTSTASAQVTHPCCVRPASKFVLVQRAQARSIAWIGFCRASGRTCSISSANRMAKKDMGR
jgi:hypothetical protein